LFFAEVGKKLEISGIVIFIEGCEPEGELRLFLVLFFRWVFLEGGELPEARGAKPLLNVMIQANSDWSFLVWMFFEGTLKG
jgi:hypothetical protein